MGKKCLDCSALRLYDSDNLFACRGCYPSTTEHDCKGFSDAPQYIKDKNYKTKNYNPYRQYNDE